MPFEITNWHMSADWVICGSSSQTGCHKADWLGWFCVLYMLLLYNTVRFVKIWAGRAVTYPQIRGYIEIKCVFATPPIQNTIKLYTG